MPFIGSGAACIEHRRIAPPRRGASAKRGANIWHLIFAPLVLGFVSISGYHLRRILPATQWRDRFDVYTIPEENRRYYEDGATAEASTLAPAPETTDYPCFPKDPQRLHRHNASIVWLAMEYHDLHVETFYSFIHQLCSCEIDIPPKWKLNAVTTPQFYVGPEKHLSLGAKRVLRIYNESTCGPLFFGQPDEEPTLTIHTTVYPRGLSNKDARFVDDPKHILICHEDAPAFENATNVYFLTPLHRHHVVPSFFPPAMINRSREASRQRQRSERRPPVFLVIGDLDSCIQRGRVKRNLDSLRHAMQSHHDRDLTVRFMGRSKIAKEDGNKTALIPSLASFGDRAMKKIDIVANANAYDYMINVGNADVILPLVDDTNFQSAYQGGKKLTSSISWGLGFGRRMVIYRPLAEAFGIPEYDRRHWFYDTPEDMADAFGRSLDDLQ